MKKGIAIALIAAAIVCIALVCGGHAAPGPGDPAAYLRVHIRADSNDGDDQAVKYMVRDAVVELLTPVAASCGTKAAALRAVEDELHAVEETAVRVLRANGFFYGVRARLERETFPARIYDGVVLPAGEYDALILELGSGEGDNWWCVVYPPLCFTGGGGNVVYKSKIAEIVRAFFR